MSEDFISREEHNEFAKRIDDENKRQNKRLDELEVIVKKLGDLPLTVKQIKENQEKQEKLLEELCNKSATRVGNAWQSFIDGLAKALAAGFIAAIVWLILNINK